MATLLNPFLEPEGHLDAIMNVIHQWRARYQNLGVCYTVLLYLSMPSALCGIAVLFQAIWCIPWYCGSLTWFLKWYYHSSTAIPNTKTEHQKLHFNTLCVCVCAHARTCQYHGKYCGNYNAAA